MLPLSFGVPLPNDPTILGKILNSLGDPSVGIYAAGKMGLKDQYLSGLTNNEECVLVCARTEHELNFRWTPSHENLLDTTWQQLKKQPTYLQCMYTSLSGET